LVAASRVLLRSLIDFILELLRELQGGGNCHYKQPSSLAMHRTQSVEIQLWAANFGGKKNAASFHILSRDMTYEDTQNLGFRTWENEFIFKICCRVLVASKIHILSHIFSDTLRFYG